MRFQSVVVGGGFFGCAIALHLRRAGYERVLLLEREVDLLTRASYRNQARVHNGYHYPRSFLTACRSRVNLPIFCRDYAFAVRKDYTSLYAVAANRSKVIPPQFERFMRDIGAHYETAGSGYRSLFDPRQIAGVYVTEEYAFDAAKLRVHFARELAAAGIHVLLGTECTSIHGDEAGIHVETRDEGALKLVETDSVFNCTYANLNHSVAATTLTPLKHEIAEVALVDPPEELRKIGVTVMDGPFFSCMPFPAEDCHSLTHVRYTPHGYFIDTTGRRDPIRELDRLRMTSRAHYMVADAARLMPCLRASRWRRSLFEIKTVLVRNEADDGRPVLLRREAIHPRVFSVLGAKIDNIYDILKRVDELLEPAEPAAAFA
jgi:glycine/D-amino acid oxidase-like deaminating enzyme